MQRFDDALLVAETCLKLDPYNGQVRGLVENIKGYKKQSRGHRAGPEARFEQLEDEVRKNPANFQAAFDLAGAYLQMQQTDRAVQVLDGVLNYPQADASALRGLLQAYGSFVSECARNVCSCIQLRCTERRAVGDGRRFAQVTVGVVLVTARVTATVPILLVSA